MPVHRKKSVRPKLLKEPIFERQRGEGAQSWAAFVVYRDDAGKRSYRKVAEALGRSLRQIERWGSVWHWQQRAAAHDADVDRASREQFKRELLEMRRQQITVGTALVGVGAQYLQHCDATDLSAKEAVQMISEGFRQLALGFGAATEITSHVESAEEKRASIVRSARQTLLVERGQVSANISNAMLRRMCAQTFGVTETELPTDAEIDAQAGKPRVIDELGGLEN
jgi:hypothetical protein